MAQADDQDWIKPPEEIQRSILLPKILDEQKAFSHRSDLLATVVESTSRSQTSAPEAIGQTSRRGDNDHPSVPARLYHWNRAGLSQVSHGSLFPDSNAFTSVAGSRYLGTFDLPESFDIPLMFSGYMSLETDAIPELTSQLLAAIVGRRFDRNKTNDTSALSFYSCPIFSSEPMETLVSSEGARLVWKWIKPASPYRTSGFWQTSLLETLEGGPRITGKDITVLVKAVSQGTFEIIERGEWTVMHLDRDLAGDSMYGPLDDSMISEHSE